MAKLTGIFRIGRDAEVRRLQDGTAVVNLALATNYGKKDQNGDRPTQWVDAAMFGERAEKLAPYLLKGNQIGAYISDVHIETYEGKNGTGSKLVGRIDDVELTDRKDMVPTQSKSSAQQSNSYADKKPQQQAPVRSSPSTTSFDDFESDIPF